jgi:hypothetical protein
VTRAAADFEARGAGQRGKNPDNKPFPAPWSSAKAMIVGAPNWPEFRNLR